MIRVENVSKSFGTFKALTGSPCTKAKGPSWPAGTERIRKTTTVKVLTTLLSPEGGGDARVAGHSVLSDPDRVRSEPGLVRAVRRRG